MSPMFSGISGTPAASALPLTIVKDGEKLLPVTRRYSFDRTSSGSI